MKKNILIISIICLFAITLNYTYSAFKKTIKGTITATTNNWKFSVSVTDGVKENDYYKVPINSTSGSFNIVLNNVGSKYYAKYTIELEKVNLPNNFVLNNSSYEGILSNESKTISVSYSSSSSANGYIKVKTKAVKFEYATMKNGYSGKTEFWSDTYRSYIRTVYFGNDLSNLPSSCKTSNLWWDISESSTQSKKVYGYLINSGEKDSNLNILYNLYIVIEVTIFAPSDCSSFFRSFTNMNNIDFNNNFNTLKVTDMNYMFYGCSSFASLDLSNFNTSNATSMNGMFYQCTSLMDLNLSNFDTLNVTDMGYMFYGCSSLIELDISNFDTSNVMEDSDSLGLSGMDFMFYGCSSLTSLDISSFNTSNVTHMDSMFCRCSKLSTTINIMSNDVTYYSSMFSNAATASGARITVNYVEDASTLVDNMIATKSSNSNVVKGSVISEPTITISGNSDIKYESNNRQEGTTVTLCSISGNYYVTSFKMNGTLVEGNTFTMPSGNVTITDVTTIACTTFETAHNPYLNSQNNVTIGEKRFTGATSLTVILDYQTESIDYDYFYIYDSASSTTGINNNKKYGGSTRTKETITINGNYIKITFTNDSSGNTYYGMKAIVIPNY